MVEPRGFEPLTFSLRMWGPPLRLLLFVMQKQKAPISAMSPSQFVGVLRRNSGLIYLYAVHNCDIGRPCKFAAKGMTSWPV